MLETYGHLQMDQYLYYRGFQKEKRKRAESLFRGIMAQNIQNMDKETDIQIQENLQRLLNKMNLHTQRHSVIKVSRVTDKENLKSIRENNLVMLKGNPSKTVRILGRSFIGQERIAIYSKL